MALFRMTINKDADLTIHKKIGAPEGAPCDGKLGREACPPAILAVGHRRKGRCDIRVA
jgi:hypothetical protein